MKKVVTMYVATRSAARFRVAGACGGVPLCLANPPPHLLRLLGAACDWDGVEGSSPIGRGLADELPNFNDVNVATAFSTFNKLCGSRSFPLNIAADDGFRGLMARARTMCADGRLKARELANLTHAVAKMSAAGKLAAADVDVQDTLAALEQRLVRVASDMDPQAVSNTVYGFAVMGRTPGDETRAALEAAVVRQARDMNAYDVSNIVYACALLGREPGAKALAALEAVVVRVGPRMNGQDVGNLFWGFATLGLMPGAQAWAALEAAVVRLDPRMNAQDVANTAWSLATLRLMPGAQALAVLEVAVVRVAPGMKPKEVANTLWAFATPRRARTSCTWAA